MATGGAPSQRAWRAACPGCGAPIEFKSAASTHAVCAYCATTVVRDGETLRQLGKASTVFDDFSPLQIGTSGQYKGRGFTLVGRLQYKWADGIWTEWYALLDGSPGAKDGIEARPWAWLSEDNGQFVWSEPYTESPAPPRASLSLDQRLAVGTTSWRVTALTECSLLNAQGELPKLAPLGQVFSVAELRNEQGRVLSVEYSSSDAATMSMGSGVKLDSLKLKGLRETSESTIKGGRQFACPHCGASLSITLDKTQSLSCPSCNSLIDVSKGIGHEVVSALQDEPIKPDIALGTTGTLAGVDWQVVGYSSMLGKAPDEPDETFGWEEYLLFNKMEGFAFLALSQEGWSLARPLSGAAVVGQSGKTASYLGSNHALVETYQAEVSYVAGEFYWTVRRGAKTQVSEFRARTATLIREKTATEVTWSRAEVINASAVMKAFGQGAARPLKEDVKPVSSGRTPIATILILSIFFLMLVLVMTQCSGKECDPSYQNCTSSGSRGWGGSYGGGSSGGGHK